MQQHLTLEQRTIKPAGVPSSLLMFLQMEQQCLAWNELRLTRWSGGGSQHWILGWRERTWLPYKEAVLSQSLQCDPQEGKDVMNFCVKNNSTHSPYSSFWKQAIFYSNLAWVTVTWSMQQPAQMALFSISTLQAPTKGMQNWEFAHLSYLLPRNCGKTLWWHFLFCAWAGSFGFEAVDSLLASAWKAKYEQRKQGKNSARAFYRLPSFPQHKKTQRTPQSLVIPLLL